MYEKFYLLQVCLEVFTGLYPYSEDREEYNLVCIIIYGIACIIIVIINNFLLALSYSNYILRSVLNLKKNLVFAAATLALVKFSLIL